MTSKHLKKIESSGVLFELNGNYDRLIPEKAIKEYNVDENTTDDGFLDAINATAAEVWGNENE